MYRQSQHKYHQLFTNKLQHVAAKQNEYNKVPVKMRSVSVENKVLYNFVLMPDTMLTENIYISISGMQNVTKIAFVQPL